MTKFYFPSSESRGGWRCVSNSDEIRTKGGMDPEKLKYVEDYLDSNFQDDSWSLVVIRHGYLLKEIHSEGVSGSTRFDVWSCAKSFTGIAWGLLLDQSRQNDMSDHSVTLESSAYDFISEGWPLTDPLKAEIKIKHLLSMTSGIAGESSGIESVPVDPQHGPFEFCLGKVPNRHGQLVDKLVATPGTEWDYSDPAMAHLSLAFYHITGQDVRSYVENRVFSQIGIENASWDVMGGGSYAGPYTNTYAGLHISARELARFGYLLLHNGNWNGKEVIPEWWVRLATTSSQDKNPQYGYTFWVNTNREQWPGMPQDMFGLKGFRCNRCYVIPSLNLVITRVGTGPKDWEESKLVGMIVDAIESNNI